MRFQIILQISLSAQLFHQCVGLCEERDEIQPIYVEGNYDEYGRYQPLNTEMICDKLTVDCKEVEFPVTWLRKNTLRYDGGDCLQVLTITRSNISTVPSSAFGEFSSFTELRITNTNLKILKPGAFNSLHSLRELYLTGNELTVVGTGIFNSLTTLKILDLSRNKIRNISVDSFSGLIHLRLLNFSSNSLVFFESAILDQNIVWLEHVDLSSNSLSHIDIHGVSAKIENLDVSNNDIHELNFCPFELISLNMSKNKIMQLKQLNCFTSSSMKFFDASFNNISRLDSSVFENLTELNHLYLQSNNISSIPTGLFSELKNLISLNLSHNQLIQFQHGTFEYLNNLRTLDISYNKISTLRRFLHPLVKLKTLYIQKNKITALNGEQLVEDSPELSFISMDGNDFSCNELVEVMHIFRKKGIYVEYDTVKNISNIYGLSCSDEENTGNSPTYITRDDHLKFENIILSKLQQLAVGDLKKSVVNDYFNKEFKNSNFYKYLETFHEIELPKFNETAIINYFNKDFENSKFYKYLEGLKNNENFTMEFNKHVFEYFDTDFKNSGFVKYLNDLKKRPDDENKSFFNSSMYNYFNRDFKNSEFYKYLESMMHVDLVNQGHSNFSEGKANRDLFVGMLVTLIVILSLLIGLIYIQFIRKIRGKEENVDLLDAREI